MTIQKIQNIDVENKKVFVRFDFNVPFDKNGIITDYTRVKAVLETIKYLLKQDCSIIMASHLGRPKGYQKQYRLEPVGKVLRAMLRLPIIFASGITDLETTKLAKKLNPGEILLLENLRFDKREVENSIEFAKELSEMADIYINDAFGVSHRAHSSIDKITDFFSIEEKSVGFLIQKESSYFKESIENPNRPFIAIIGGSKVSTKLKTIKKLLGKVDKIIIGGAMAFTFLKAQGYKVGNSLVENDLLEESINILKTAKKLNKELILPIDFVISDIFGDNGTIKTIDYNKIPDNFIGLDIGKKSIDLFEEKCRGAKTIFWNGPMGAYEFESFFEGSSSIANILANSSSTTFVGGGDSISVINKLGLGYDIDFISTGGGASLKLLEGEKLIGIEKLKKI